MKGSQVLGKYEVTHIPLLLPKILLQMLPGGCFKGQNGRSQAKLACEYFFNRCSLHIVFMKPKVSCFS